jgi:glycosyltransferase involved in cell wall biosynthesis
VQHTPPKPTKTRARVLVVTHLFPTPSNLLQGPWVAEQVDASSSFADISVLCCSRSATRAETLRSTGVRAYFAPTDSPFGSGRVGLIASSARYRAALRRHLAAHAADYDLLHAHFGFPDGVLVAAAARRAGLPHVITLHGDDGYYLISRHDWLGHAVRTSLDSAARVICVSESMANVVRRHVRDAEKVIVVTNGYDDELFRLSHQPRNGVLFVGTLTKVKNVDLLLRTYGSLAPRLGEHLTIVGDGPLRAGLERLAADLGISARVSFLGVQSREKVCELMGTARCLVLPSSNESWGVVVAEALACGTPVVASHVGGLPEIVRDPVAGVLVEPGNGDALACALLEVLERRHEPSVVASGSGAMPWRRAAAPLAEVYGAVGLASRD